VPPANTESVWIGPTSQNHLDRALEHLLRGEQQCSALTATPCAPRTLALECEANSNSLFQMFGSTSPHARRRRRRRPLTLALLHTLAGRRRWIKIGELHPTRDHGLSENLDRSLITRATQAPHGGKYLPMAGGSGAQSLPPKQKRRRCETEAMGPIALLTLRSSADLKPRPVPPPCRHKMASTRLIKLCPVWREQRHIRQLAQVPSFRLPQELRYWARILHCCDQRSGSSTSEPGQKCKVR